MKNILLIFALSLSAFAQTETCNLALKDSPEIRGLKLGMSKQDVEKIIPASEVKLSDFLNYLNDKQLLKLKGFETVKTLDIVFNRKSDIYTVDSLAFKYKESVVEWDNNEEFAKNLSENLNLPFRFWDFSSTVTASMACKDFNVVISASNNSIRINSTISEQRMRQTNEIKKKVFKP